MEIKPTKKVAQTEPRHRRTQTDIAKGTYDDITTVALEALYKSDQRIKDALESRAPGLYEDIYINGINIGKQEQRLTIAIQKIK